jgi:hypothetical protein
MSGEDIDALKVLKLIILDQAVSFHVLEESAFQNAKHLAKVATRSLIGIKRLINYSMKDLQVYLGVESQELLTTLGAF